MRIGIVADIHEHVGPLAEILEFFRRSSVDQIVTLGDTCDVFSDGRRALETVRLLQAAGAVGVWGNHDLSLCREVSERQRQRYAPEVLAFMATMQPHLALADCLFSHVDPWLDPHNPENLWYYDGPLVSVERTQWSFAAVPQRFLFMGHLHSWQLLTATGRVDGAGQRPIVLDQAPRYLTVLAPASEGHGAIFDTETLLLTPVPAGGGRWASGVARLQERSCSQT